MHILVKVFYNFYKILTENVEWVEVLASILLVNFPTPFHDEILESKLQQRAQWFCFSSPHLNTFYSI